MHSSNNNITGFCLHWCTSVVLCVWPSQYLNFVDRVNTTTLQACSTAGVVAETIWFYVQPGSLVKPQVWSHGLKSTFTSCFQVSYFTEISLFHSQHSYGLALFLLTQSTTHPLNFSQCCMLLSSFTVAHCCTQGSVFPSIKTPVWVVTKPLPKHSEISVSTAESCLLSLGLSSFCEGELKGHGTAFLWITFLQWK